MLQAFLSAKRVEGCSDKSIEYYRTTLEFMIKKVNKSVRQVTTEDLRTYLAEYQQKRRAAKVTIDNIHRIFSSFFSSFFHG